MFSRMVELEKDVFGPGAWDDQFFKELIKNKFDYIIAAKSPFKILGYGIIRCLMDADILSLAVDKDERNKGIGLKLLNEMIKCAVENRCGNVFLEVRSKNLFARKLYESAGFEIIGMRTNYYCEPSDDAIVMRYIC